MIILPTKVTFYFIFFKIIKNVLELERKISLRYENGIKMWGTCHYVQTNFIFILYLDG